MDERIQAHIQENQERIDSRNADIEAAREIRERTMRGFRRNLNRQIHTRNTCTHESQIRRRVEPTEHRGVALDGGFEIRCANYACGELLEVQG